MDIFQAYFVEALLTVIIALLAYIFKTLKAEISSLYLMLKDFLININDIQEKLSNFVNKDQMIIFDRKHEEQEAAIRSLGERLAALEASMKMFGERMTEIINLIERYSSNEKK